MMFDDDSDGFFDTKIGPMINRVEAQEHYIIHPLPLLKMIVHARKGIPFEVMGLMLGEKLNDYCITLVDVFAMPQTASNITVESFDPEFQADMMELLPKTGRPEMSIGWYHSHPGFGCWLSSTDVATQADFEKLDKRALAVVIDPIQSVKGNVVIDGFRAISNMLVSEHELMDVNCNNGFLNEPTMTAILQGHGQSFYSVRSEFTSCSLEKRMLKKLRRSHWMRNLKIPKISHEEEAFRLENEIREEIEDKKLVEKLTLKKQERVNKIKNFEFKPKKENMDYLDEALESLNQQVQKEKEEEIVIEEKVFNVKQMTVDYMKRATNRQFLVNLHRKILKF